LVSAIRADAIWGVGLQPMSYHISNHTYHQTPFFV
jgi:hypothetical protein